VWYRGVAADSLLLRRLRFRRSIGYTLMPTAAAAAAGARMKAKRSEALTAAASEPTH